MEVKLRRNGLGNRFHEKNRNSVPERREWGVGKTREFRYPGISSPRTTNPEEPYSTMEHRRDIGGLGTDTSKVPYFLNCNNSVVERKNVEQT